MYFAPTGNIVRKFVDGTGTANDKVTYYIYDAAGKQLLAVYEQTKETQGEGVGLWKAPILKEAPITAQNA